VPANPNQCLRHKQGESHRPAVLNSIFEARRLSGAVTVTRVAGHCVAPFAVRWIALFSITRITPKSIARIAIEPIPWIPSQPVPRTPHMCNRDPLLRKRLDRLPNDDKQRRKQCDQAHQPSTTDPS
jgi:hypothetical protein